MKTLNNLVKIIRPGLVLFTILALSAGGQAAFAAPGSSTENDVASAPLFAPAASVALNVPSQSMLGEDVAFTVTFDNTGADPGYGPFIDLILDTTGPDGISPGTPAPANTYDGLGITQVSASYLGTPIASSDFFVLTFNSSGNATHPLVRNASGNFITVTGTPGDKLVVIRLPFGSFTPAQPAADVSVSVDMSNLADVGTPLNIQARGGFQFGSTPLDDWCCGDSGDLTLTSWTARSVTPVLFTVSKTYNGPEDETATGPNFPRRYTLTLDIADGQSLTNFNLTDLLPNNLQYVSLISASPAGYTTTLPNGDEPLTGSAQNPPNNDLIVFWPSIPGGPAASDASATFEFFVPRDDANGARVLDPVSGNDVTSCNQASASGSWAPLDSRDPVSPISQNPAGCEHTLTDKSIAIQKGVTVLGGGDPAPGTTLEYTLNYQVSDFFAFDSLVVTDVISDGQRFDTTFTPTMTVNGNGFTYAAANIVPANYTVDESEIDLTDGPPPAPENPATNGTTTFTIRASDEVVTRSSSLPVGNARTQAALGRLIGGCVPLTGSAAPDCGSYNDGATTVTITFRTVVQELFTDDYPSGDWSVDQGDTLVDNVTVLGNVLDTATFAVQGANTEDDSSNASVVLDTGALTKSIYAINGSTSFPSPVEVKPGDTVTYRIRYTMPISDEENLELTDYLPLPVFHVGDPDENGVAGPAWTFDTTVSVAVPAAGVAKFGPSDTFFTYSGIIPTITSSVTENSLVFTYGDFDSPSNVSTTVDILFTVTVSDDPFADGLYLTNQANAYEGSTNGGLVAANAIVQIILTEPALSSTKGVVWTSSANDSFTPANIGPAGVTFLDPLNAPRWTGTINSSGLAGNPIDSNVSGVDAGDIVTFAITIENSGSSLNGAFDIEISDTLQPQYDIPVGGLNLQVYYGNGSGPISYTGLGGGPDAVNGTADDLFGNGIQLVDPVGVGVCQAHDPNLGNNVIVITYDLQIRPTVSVGDVINTASLNRYAGSEGGPNFLAAPQTDTATVSLSAAPEKYLVATSEAGTGSVGGIEQVAIGEVVRYRLVVRLPEGTSSNFQLQDLLPNGLIFLNDGTAEVGFVSTGGIVSSDTGTLPVPAIPGACNIAGSTANATTPANLTCALADANIGSTNSTGANDDTYNAGSDPYFKLGDLVNNDLDIDDEFVVIEFNALVHNQTANQNDNTENIDNQVRVFIGGVQSGSDSPAVRVRIVEPFLTLDKTNSAISAIVDAGDTVTYTVTLANPVATSTAAAYDVRFVDALNASYLTLIPASINVSFSGAASAVTDNSSGNTLDLIVASIPVGDTVTITYQATVTGSVTPQQAVDNTGDVTWTSLPGPNGTTPNGTGSTTPGAGGTNTGERDGSGGANNDYAATDTSTFNIYDPFFSKTIEFTDVPGTIDPDTTIGEVITFGLYVTLPEGTTPTLQIVDDIPAGMAFVNGSDVLVTTQPPAACGSLTADFGGTVPAPTLTLNPPAGGDGADVTFDFGAITVTGDNNAGNNTFLICLEAVVLNVAGNQDGDTLTNNASMQVGTSPVLTDAVDVDVVEPVLRITKIVNELFPIPNQVLTFTLTVDHAPGNTVDAYDVVVFDDLAGNLTLDLASVTLTPSGGVTGVTDASAGNRVEVRVDEFPAGGSLTVQFEAEFIGNLGDTLVNAGNVTWTSTPDDANPEERNSGGGANDYSASDNVGLANTRELEKSLVATNHANTLSTDAAIGEILTYQVVLTLPAASTDTAIVLDTLDSGLAFVDCSDIVAGPNVTSSTVNFTLAGNCNPGTAVTDNPQVQNSGGLLRFDFGTVVNANPTLTETITITYRVVVLDIVSNNDGLPTVLLDNDVEWQYATTSLTDSAPQVRIREPDLGLEKTVDPTVALPGATVTYTLRVTHTADTQADAFDLILTDILPLGLEFSGGTPTVSTASGQAPNTVTYDALTRTLTVGWDTFLRGATSELEIPAQLATTLNRGTSINNEASLAWSSLPGDVSAPQSIFNARSTERLYDPLNPADVYVVDSAALLTIPALPKTGFAPGRVTLLPQQPDEFKYAALDGLWMEIPKLKVKMSIVGVPFNQANWDLSWLGSQAGYLDGTAYPTHDGNSGITAHAYLASGAPGPFAKLDQLRYGDQIIVHMGGLRYIYEVRQNQLVKPNDLSVLKHEEYPWLTLITCKSYSETSGDYLYRVSVRAVLVKVEADQ